MVDPTDHFLVVVRRKDGILGVLGYQRENDALRAYNRLIQNKQYISLYLASVLDTEPKAIT